MQQLILKQNNKYMTIHDQFTKGIKVRPHRLANVDQAVVIKNDQITCVYDLDLSSLKYNAYTGRIDLHSILDGQDLHSDLINQFVKYETSTPATIKDAKSIVVGDN